MASKAIIIFAVGIAILGYLGYRLVSPKGQLFQATPILAVQDTKDCQTGSNFVALVFDGDKPGFLACLHPVR